jgi:hypothetical protein
MKMLQFHPKTTETISVQVSPKNSSKRCFPNKDMIMQIHLALHLSMSWIVLDHDWSSDGGYSQCTQRTTKRPMTFATGEAILSYQHHINIHWATINHLSWYRECPKHVKKSNLPTGRK